MSRDILLSLIDPNPDQPRKHFDEDKLNELAQSIQANGLASPILLRPNGERFIIGHGERRWRAARLLKWESIPAEVRDISQDEGQWLALAENVQRADLSPIEEAQAYKSRLDEGLTQEQLGQRIGKTQSYIATKLRLLRLSEPIQQLIKQGLLTEGHAKQLLRLKDDEYSQNHIAKFAAAFGQSVADVKQAVDSIFRLAELEGKISHGFDDLNKMREAFLSAKGILDDETYNSWLKSIRLNREIADLIEGAPWLDQGQLACLAVEAINLGLVTVRAAKAIETLRNEKLETLEQCKRHIDVASHWQNELAAARIRGEWAAGKLLANDDPGIGEAADV